MSSTTGYRDTKICDKTHLENSSKNNPCKKIDLILRKTTNITHIVFLFNTNQHIYCTCPAYFIMFIYTFVLWLLLVKC